jgi:GNAT superfamily N-acetyltransferase
VPANEVSYSAWEVMWRQYSASSQPAADRAAPELTYARLVDSAFCLYGLVAVDELPIGFAHYYFHPSSWSVGENCCLQDLYVSAVARGQGVGRALIEEVARQARERGGTVLHWRTRESNAAAHALYSKLSQRTDFVSYRLLL